MKKCETKCGRAVKGRVYLKNEDCLPCWLEMNVPQAFGSESNIETAKDGLKIRSPACYHLDEYTVIDRRDSGCMHRQILTCDVFGKCTTGEVIPGIANCFKCEYHSAEFSEKPKHVHLYNHELCPGDIMAFTGAVRSIHLAHPGKFLTSVSTTAQEIWQYNPDVFVGNSQPVQSVELKYELVHKSDERSIHFIQACCQHLEQELKVPVPIMVNSPHVVLSDEEKSWINQVHETFDYQGKYWVINAGYKHDITAKHWGFKNFRELVGELANKIQFVQVGEEHENHFHEPIPGAFNLIGKTSTRQFLRLVYHSAGAVGPLSFLMHAAAAFAKPYVCLAGGREPVAWNAYPKQTTFHTVGKLPCCQHGSCWKELTVKSDKRPQGKTCLRTVEREQILPECMDSIRPSDVAHAVISYKV